MSKLEAEGGKIVVDLHICPRIFVGCSGDGIFPPTDILYERFSCTPKKDTGGILVFRTEPKNLAGDIRYDCYQYEWVDGKVVVGCKIKTQHALSQSAELGFSVSCGRYTYVTRDPNAANRNYKVVDVIDLIRYAEGKIGIADLERNSRSLERREARMENIMRLKEELGCQKQQVDELTLSMSYWKNGYQSLHSKIARLQDWWLVRIIDRLFFGGHLAFVRDRAKNPDVFLKKFSM